MVNTDTVAFETRTYDEPRSFPSVDSFFVSGIDFGYSGVKMITGNKIACRPSFAIKQQPGAVRLSDPNPTDILYRGEDGNIWVVGRAAFAEMKDRDLEENYNDMYSRHHFQSDMFKAVSRTSIALAMMPNEMGNMAGRRFVLQTGLPEGFLEDDEAELIEALSGHHVFDVKFGSNSWIHFDYELYEAEKAFKMPPSVGAILPLTTQPRAGLFSASYGRDGKPNKEKITKFCRKERGVIIDPGFKTFDYFLIDEGNISSSKGTDEEFSMHTVFEKTCKDIREQTGAKIDVSELQLHLKEGYIFVNDPGKRFSRKKVDFTDILLKNAQEYANKAIDAIAAFSNNFKNCTFMIASGGTYETWKGIFNEAFKDLDGFEIYPANWMDTTISNMYSNARGYYFIGCTTLHKMLRTK